MTSKAKAPANPYCKRAEGYVRGVVSGRIVANKWTRLACTRHLRDLERTKRDKSWPYEFDTARAERACRFMEKFPHIKGRWARARERVKLEAWQCFLTVSIFGWVERISRRRRFKHARLYVARKNGKSTWAALVGLYMLAADGEAGAEVYSGAAKNEKQAWEVFGPARLMALRTDDYRAKWGVDVLTRNLSSPLTASKFEPIIGKPGDGASPHCAIHDEYHEHKTDEQVDAMRTGMGAREQPLQLIISTAGDNLAGPCFEDWRNLQRVLEGVLENDRLFGVVYSADLEDSWLSDAAIRKANPNLGVSVTLDDLRAEREEARNSPRKQAVYKTKKLNLWVQSREAYFNVQKWIECTAPEMELVQFIGQPAWIGVDLAATTDVAAVKILIDLMRCSPGHQGAASLRARGFAFASFGVFYIPEATVQLPENEHYRGWDTEGRLVVTDGSMTDLARIEGDLRDLLKQLKVIGIGFDPWQAAQMMQNLQRDNAPVVEYRQTVLNYSAPMKTMDGWMQSRQLAHDGCPVMTWMVSNVVAKIDAKDNVYPRKERPQNKIDGPVALMTCIGLHSVAPKLPDIERAILERGGFA